MHPMTINIVRLLDYLPGDHAQIEIGGVVQPDSVTLAGPDRERQGFGFGSSDATGFGLGRGLPFGAGVLGGGRIGQGAEAIPHRTVRSFVAGDYTVRVRSIDALGNVSAWSSPVTVKHRPLPPPPKNLRVVDGSLTWDWNSNDPS